MNEPEDPPQKDVNPFAPTSEIKSIAQPSMDVSTQIALGLTTLIAFSFFLNLTLGFCMLLLAAPAYIRTARSTYQKIAAGEALTISEQLLTFISSIAAVLLCFFAGTIGLFVTCISLLTVGDASNGFWANSQMQNIGAIIFLVLCSSAWIGTAGLVYWLMWPGRKNAAKKNAFNKNKVND